MSDGYRGFFKLQEEMGELNQALGKLGPFPHGRHPDGGKDLRKRVEDELADVSAAITYFASKNGLTVSHDRQVMKLRMFEEWGLTGIPMEPSS